jgi:hypothetical protein
MTINTSEASSRIRINTSNRRISNTSKVRINTSEASSMGYYEYNCSKKYLRFNVSFLYRLHQSVMPCIPDDFEQKTWDHLRRAVFAIQAGLPLPGYSLEELYQVFNYCFFFGLNN